MRKEQRQSHPCASCPSLPCHVSYDDLSGLPLHPWLFRRGASREVECDRLAPKEVLAGSRLVSKRHEKNEMKHVRRVPAFDAHELETREAWAVETGCKDAHLLVEKLREKAPMHVDAPHLKRVRKVAKEQVHVLVCFADETDDGMGKIGCARDLVMEWKLEPFLVQVPKLPPPNRNKQKEWSQDVWPVGYRPCKGMRDGRDEEERIEKVKEDVRRGSETFLLYIQRNKDVVKGMERRPLDAVPTNGRSKRSSRTVEEENRLVDSKHRKKENEGDTVDQSAEEGRLRDPMVECPSKEFGCWHPGPFPGDDGAMVVDPATGHVVAFAKTEYDVQCSHPLRHPVMLVVQEVAEKQRILRTQAALAQGRNLPDKLHSPARTEAAAKPGESQEHLEYHGADYLSFHDFRQVNPADLMQYLCTGYDCYLWHEPCAMCAMALVHSRVRRVVFHKEDKRFGCLSSAQKIHGLKGINHRYEVYHVTN